MSPYTGQLGEAGIAPETAAGTFVVPTVGVRFRPPFDFSVNMTLLESQGVSGIPDMVTKTAQGPAELKSGKIKFEVEPEGGLGQHLMAAFGVDTMTETASFIVSTGVNDTIDFVCAAGTKAATVSAGTFPIGLNSGTDASGTLCYKIAAAMAVADSAHVYTAVFNPATNGVTISTNQATGTFSLLFLSGTNNAKTMAPLLGYTKTDETGAYTYTAQGAVVAVGSHLFSRIASASLPTYSWWQKTGVDYPTFAGCMLSKLEFDIKAKEYVVASADWIGLKYASGSTESLTYSTHQPFEWDQAVVTVGGTGYTDYEDLKITIDNSCENVHTVSATPYANKNYSKGFKVSIGLTLTVENTTEWAKYPAGTLSSLTVALTSSEFVKGSIPFALTFTMTNIAYKAAPRPIPKDLIKITFSADATSSVNSSTTLTVTLVNSVCLAYSTTN